MKCPSLLFLEDALLGGFRLGEIFVLHFRGCITNFWGISTLFAIFAEWLHVGQSPYIFVLLESYIAYDQ